MGRLNEHQKARKGTYHSDEFSMSCGGSQKEIRRKNKIM